MADPAAIGQAIGAAVATLIGVDGQALFWSWWGATIGITFAAKAPALRMASVFVATVLVCGLLGSWGSARWFAGEALARNTLACLSALVFHPVLNATVVAVQPVLHAMLRKFGIDIGPQP